MKRAALLLLALVLCFGAGFLTGKRGPQRDPQPQIDTLYLHDTITVSEPRVVAVRTVDTLLVPVRDTIRLCDSVFIQLPREEKVYQDSTYRAVVSGFRPSLDSLQIFQTTTFITRTIREPERRWHFSAGVGPAVIYTPFHPLHIDAGVGIFAGVTYNF